MKKLPFLCFLVLSTVINEKHLGVSKVDITPPVGTPSAGYTNRKGEGMVGVKDPLLAIALFIDNGEKKIAFCSVDHLGFTYEMVEEIKTQVQAEIPGCEIYIGSSHTHSGGGAYLNIPFIGESLAGKYDPQIRQGYIDKTALAIVQASKDVVLGKIGLGYGHAANLSSYRASYPESVTPVSDIAVIKVTKEDDTPLAILFNYAVHPTILKSENREFSADFVGHARNQIQALLGSQVQPIYFNGAQGDIVPLATETCDSLGASLAKSAVQIWNQTKASEDLTIDSAKTSYSFKPEATPAGLLLPVKQYQSEMNLIVLNREHAFLTVPGELSCVYDQRLKEAGSKLGYSHLSILGLTNDAHGYIILPEAWAAKTYESNLSFGGKSYGQATEDRAISLLKKYELIPKRL